MPLVWASPKAWTAPMADPAVKAIVITGAKSLLGGADIKEFGSPKAASPTCCRSSAVEPVPSRWWRRCQRGDGRRPELSLGATTA